MKSTILYIGVPAACGLSFLAAIVGPGIVAQVCAYLAGALIGAYLVCDMETDA